MSFLKPPDETAKPGKSRKLSEEQRAVNKHRKNKEYELKRKVRTFDPDWKIDFPWVHFDSDKQIMTCEYCIDLFGKDPSKPFVKGSSNFRTSSLSDHGKSAPHQQAEKNLKSKKATLSEKVKSIAGTSLRKLKVAERYKVANLFRNAHFVAKANRPISDFKILSALDKAKGIEVGETYINDQAAEEFISYIGKIEVDKTQEISAENPFLSFMMDGTTDISGDELETLYLRTAKFGKVTERFINIGKPQSTCSEDLFNHVKKVFGDLKIDTSKMVSMGSDGASNMVGVKAGLATLLKKRVNQELINVHCFAHRLELAFRDNMKNNKQYEKLMTLLIGLYYFYKKSYKNKSGLQSAIKVMGEGGLLPPKVTGTRWLPHLLRGISALLKTYRPIEAHLSTASHNNPKAEGLYKIMTSQQTVAFMLFLQDALEPAMKLSLKLQKSDVTLADSLCWLDATLEVLHEKKGEMCEAVQDVLDSGHFKGVKLKGPTPLMKYTDLMLEGFGNALKTRFMTESKNVVNATKVLDIKNWPMTTENKDYGNEEVSLIVSHFTQTLKRANGNTDLTVDAVLTEWAMLKKLVSKKYDDLSVLKWETIFRDIDELHKIRLVVDLMLTLPSTSVKCETAFSQLKLLKTCRRSRLNQSNLNNLMVVKLLSPDIADFDPNQALDIWQCGSEMGRRPTYKRTPKRHDEGNETSRESCQSNEKSSEASESCQPTEVFDLTSDAVTVADFDYPSESENEIEVTESVYGDEFESSIAQLCDGYGKKQDNDDDDVDFEEECFDYQDELMNFDNILLYSRE